MSASTLRWFTFGLLAGAVLLSGCSSEDITAVKAIPLAQVEVVNSSPDAGRVNVQLDGTVVGPPLAYANASGYLSVANATTDVQLLDLTGTSLVDIPVAVTAGVPYTVFVCDSAASLKPVIVADDWSAVPARKARVRFLNLAAGEAAFDLTSGGHVLAAGLAFMQSTPWQLLDAGSYNVTVDTTGTSDDRPYTTQDGVALNDGGVYTVFVRGKALSGEPKAPGVVMVQHH